MELVVTPRGGGSGGVLHGSIARALSTRNAIYLSSVAMRELGQTDYVQVFRNGDTWRIKACRASDDAARKVVRRTKVFSCPELWRALGGKEGPPVEGGDHIELTPVRGGLEVAL